MRSTSRHVFLCTQAFAPRMIEQADGGSIVNVSTVEAFRGIPMQVVYSAFKAGVIQFTKSLALDLGGDGIRVNAIAPDLTQTIQVPYDRWVPEEQEHLIPRVGARRPVRDAGRHRGRGVVPGVGPVGVRDRHDCPRRRRKPRRRGLVPHRARRLDEPSAEPLATCVSRRR